MGELVLGASAVSLGAAVYNFFVLLCGAKVA